MNNKINELIIDNYFSESDMKIIDEIKKIKVLNSKEEKELIIKAQSGDLKARDRLIKSNLMKVVDLSINFIDKGVDFLDLIQEGSVGLVEAIDNYNFNKKSFRNYVYSYVYNALDRATKRSDLIKQSLECAKFCKKFAKAKDVLTSELHREPDMEEIALAMNLSPEAINNKLAESIEVVSLDEPVDGEDVETLMDCIPIEEDYQKDIENVLLHDELYRVLEKLSESSYDEFGTSVLIKRFGLDDGVPKTLKEVGDYYGYCAERIRQIESKAIRKLRAPKFNNKISKYF